MSKFEYTVTDPNGLHARPAGLLVKKAQSYANEITVECNGRSAGMKRLLSLMGMGIRCGDTVTVTVEGENAPIVAAELQTYLKENL